MAPIASLATHVVMAVQAHIADLLATRQVRPGDKLPLEGTVKETDATKPFSLTPTGRNIFVRMPPFYLSPSSYFTFLPYAHYFKT